MCNDLSEVNPQLATEFLMMMEWGVSPKAGKQDLLAMSGSFDEGVRNEARVALEQMWFLQPEHSANAERVKHIDLLKTFENFDDSTKEFILKNIVAIEFTRGCNGGCSYCFLGEKPRGITHTFSFNSMQAFFTKYGQQIQDNAPYKVYPYFNTDFLDYRDGEKTALDVYQLLLVKCPVMTRTINTSLPTGSQDVFVDLALRIVDISIETYSCPTKINLSISGHNAQRAEVCLALIEKKLYERGLSKNHVNFLMKQMIDVKPKDAKSGKGLQLVGKNLERQDAMEDIGSPACLDGVVLSPDNSRSVSMVAATPINRTGNFELPIQDGRLFMFDSIWMYLKIKSDKNESRNEIRRFLDHKIIFMQPIMTNSGEIYGDDSEWNDEERTNRLDEILVGISRDALGIQYFEETLAHFCSLDIPNHQLGEFVALAKEQLQQKCLEIEEKFARLERLTLTRMQKDMIEYLKQLHTLLSAKTNLVLDTYESRNREEIYRLSIVLSHIGLRLSSQLPVILNELSNLRVHSLSHSEDKEFRNFIEKYWGDRNEAFKNKMFCDLR